MGLFPSLWFFWCLDGGTPQCVLREQLPRALEKRGVRRGVENSDDAGK